MCPKPYGYYLKEQPTYLNKEIRISWGSTAKCVYAKLI
jgi:hypothetical protein